MNYDEFERELSKWRGKLSTLNQRLSSSEKGAIIGLIGLAFFGGWFLG